MAYWQPRPAPMRASHRWAATALATLTLACGCAEPTEVTDVITAPIVVPSGGTLDGRTITLAKGRTIAFVGQPMNEQETLKQTITLASLDESVARAFSLEEMNHFAVVGVETGDTTLNVIDGDGNRSSITFTVTVTAP